MDTLLAAGVLTLVWIGVYLIFGKFAHLSFFREFNESVRKKSQRDR